MEEFMSPSWAIGIGLVFVGLGFSALQLMSSSDEIIIAKGCFFIAAIIFVVQTFAWGTTTSYSVWPRLIVCLILFGAIGWLSTEAFRYVDRRGMTKPEAAYTTETPVPLSKALFEEVQDPEYRDLVAEIIQSFDPEAHIAVGNAIDGPDGFRRVDVEVRSSDNKLIVVDIISRSDGRKVSVEVVDRADSKRRDVKADAMLVCSNTGFDQIAIRKAKRLHIGLIAVAKQGDKRIKAAIQEEIYLRKVDIAPVTVEWVGVVEADVELLRKYVRNAHDLTFDGRPVVGWLQQKVAAIVVYNPMVQIPLVANFDLKSPAEFSVQGHPVMLQALRVRFHPRVQWLSQVVELDAMSAIYSYVRGRFILSPGFNQLVIKDVNFDTATPMVSPPSVEDLGFGLLPGEIEMAFVMVSGLGLPKDTGNNIPNLDHLIEPEDLVLKVKGALSEKTGCETSIQ